MQVSDKFQGNVVAPMCIDCPGRMVGDPLEQRDFQEAVVYISDMKPDELRKYRDHEGGLEDLATDISVANNPSHRADTYLVTPQNVAGAIACAQSAECKTYHEEF